MRQMRVTRSQTRHDRPVSPQCVARSLSAEDEEMEEEDKFLMLEFGYGDEAGGDRPMSPTSLLFPGFALKSYDQLQDFL